MTDWARTKCRTVSLRELSAIHSVPLTLPLLQGLFLQYPNLLVERIQSTIIAGTFRD